MNRSLLASLFVGCALLACTSSRTPSGGGGPIPVDRLDEEYGSAVCHLLFACGIASDDTISLRLAFGDESRCRAQIGRLLGAAAFEDLQRLVASGAVSYDDAAAGECLAEVRASCTSIFGGAEPADVCNEVFTGTVPEGSSCWRGEECLGDAFCAHGDVSRSCPGTCTARRPLGSPCERRAMCQRVGLSGYADCWFDETASESRCVDVVQAPVAAEGAPCGFLGEEAGVVRIAGCATGLWCTGSDSSPGVCRVPVAAGAACASDDEVCVDGHLCIGGACRPLTVARMAGAACGEASLTFCDPTEGLLCDETGVCSRLGDGSAGSPCRGGDLSAFTCNPGLVCLSDTSSCGPPRAAGDLCDGDGECASGDCDYETSTCRERVCTF